VIDKQFCCIGILGSPRKNQSLITHKILYYWLTKQGYDVLVETDISKKLDFKAKKVGTLNEIGKTCDLAIVIGGDGNMLNAARILSMYNIKIIGINRGKLGFLTDLDPETALQTLAQVLEGQYIIENRFFLKIQLSKKFDNKKKSFSAINEVVLHSDKVSNMIDFEVYINGKFAFSQIADGLIVSTPTGSTGYALSAGGPILENSLKAIILIPMFPHTLSSRPIIIDNKSCICLKVMKVNSEVQISCDNQIVVPIKLEEKVFIRKSKKYLSLIHPKNYDFFKTLKSKLNWSNNLFNKKTN